MSVCIHVSCQLSWQLYCWIFFVYACQLLVLPPRKLPILAAHTHCRALHVRYPYSDCTGRSYILGKLSPQIFKFLFDYLVLAHSIQISWYDTNTKVLWSCEIKKWIAFVIDCWIYVLMWPIWRKQSMSLTYVVLCVVGHSYCFEYTRAVEGWLLRVYIYTQQPTLDSPGVLEAITVANNAYLFECDQFRKEVCP